MDRIQSSFINDDICQSWLLAAHSKRHLPLSNIDALMALRFRLSIQTIRRVRSKLVEKEWLTAQQRADLARWQAGEGTKRQRIKPGQWKLFLDALREQPNPNEAYLSVVYLSDQQGYATPGLSTFLSRIKAR